jgi:branched-chain amino acid transport system permease protein
MTLARHTGLALLAAIVVVILTVQLSDYRDYQIAQIAAYVIAVGGLTVLIGMSGQISIGHGAFMAVGGYATEIFLLHVHWSVTLSWSLIHLHWRLAWNLAMTFLAATVISALAGAVVGVAAARLRGPYLAGATLLLAVAVPASVVNTYQSVFGGDQGLSFFVANPSFVPLSVSLSRFQAWLSIATALIALILLANLARSRVGRNWRALRDDEVAAALSGLNVALLQVRAFVVSSACAGLAGALLAVVMGGATPSTYVLTLSIGLLTAAVLGGLGSLAGALWGACVLVLVPVFLTNFATSHGFSVNSSPNIPVIAYGVVLIVVMLVFPSGIQGGVRRFFGFAQPAVSGPVNSVRRLWPAREHQEEQTR